MSWNKVFWKALNLQFLLCFAFGQQESNIRGEKLLSATTYQLDINNQVHASTLPIQNEESDKANELQNTLLSNGQSSEEVLSDISEAEKEELATSTHSNEKISSTEGILAGASAMSLLDRKI